jgi:Na+-translocating ferredoxin:NAD+ oxidoreductase RnfA subunit
MSDFASSTVFPTANMSAIFNQHIFLSLDLTHLFTLPFFLVVASFLKLFSQSCPLVAAHESFSINLPVFSLLSQAVSSLGA